MITDRIGLHSVLLPILIILLIKQIGRTLRGRPILLIPCMIKDRVGLHSVLSACGGSVAERLKRWTCNSEVVGILNPVMFDLNYLFQSFARRH